MNIIIRKALPEDAATITMLTHQLGYSISIEQTLQNIKAITANKDHTAFVAVHEKQVIGWICLSYMIQLESPPVCELRGLVIDEGYRKMGIGKMLINEAKRWSKEKGNDQLRLRCNAKRTETHLFYKHLGFKEIKQQKVFVIDLDN
ncbi:MAG TPA: GNAT family N-acetyltransferase [Chitinophagaceae bacterium]|jgi:GNAT superfamily N-acetyltransferase|nr:GNAT family N-acetyltransferase [Chitinophagaceae bacterium]